MSFYGDALAAIKSIILIEDRVSILSGKMERLAAQMHDMSGRVTRLETIIEITRPDGATLRIAPKPIRKSATKSLK